MSLIPTNRITTATFARLISAISAMMRINRRILRRYSSGATGMSYCPCWIPNKMSRKSYHSVPSSSSTSVLPLQVLFIKIFSFSPFPTIKCKRNPFLQSIESAVMEMINHGFRKSTPSKNIQPQSYSAEMEPLKQPLLEPHGPWFKDCLSLNKKLVAINRKLCKWYIFSLTQNCWC